MGGASNEIWLAPVLQAQDAEWGYLISHCFLGGEPSSFEKKGWLEGADFLFGLGKRACEGKARARQ